MLRVATHPLFANNKCTSARGSHGGGAWGENVATLGGGNEGGRREGRAEFWSTPPLYFACGRPWPLPTKKKNPEVSIPLFSKMRTKSPLSHRVKKNSPLSIKQRTTIQNETLPTKNKTKFVPPPLNLEQKREQRALSHNDKVTPIY